MLHAAFAPVLPRAHLSSFFVASTILLGSLAAAALVAENPRHKVNPNVGIYSEKRVGYAGALPKGVQQAVELLRFVTPYGVAYNATVDITHYSALLHAAVKSGTPLSFYSFIDTWSDNQTDRKAVYVDNETDVCEVVPDSDGNGWRLSAELVFYGADAAAPQAADVRPSELVVLASGPYTQYSIGRVETHHARLVHSNGSRASIVMDKPVSLDQASSAMVFECGSADAQSCEYNLRTLALDNQIVLEGAQMFDKLIKSGKEKKVGDAAEEYHDELVAYSLESQSVGVWVQSVLKEGLGGELNVSINTYSAKVVPGSTPVYADLVRTPTLMDNHRWINLTGLPKHLGRITEDLGHGFFRLRLDHGCLPAEELLGKNTPLIVPASPRVLPDADRRSSRTVHQGLSIAHEKNPQLKADLWASLHTRSLGHLDVEAEAVGPQSNFKVLGTSKAKLRQASAKATLLVARAQGRLLDRDFHMPSLRPGDRILAHLVSTGHGWANTQEQCGEYCQVHYTLSLNGKLAQTVEQWRADCKDNPVSPQHGTWWEERNGWCPGSVNHGTFLDVTDLVRKGHNKAALDIRVLENRTGDFSNFTNLKGYAWQDDSSLMVSLSLAVYQADVVAKLKAVRRNVPSFTRAEAALRGVPQPPIKEKRASLAGTLPASALLMERSPTRRALTRTEASLWVQTTEPPLQEVPTGSLWVARPEPSSSALLTLGRRKLAAESGNQSDSDSGALHGRASSCVGSGARNFEARAPWYNGGPELEAEGDCHKTVRLPVISDVLVQGASRTHVRSVEHDGIPENWVQVALHLRLEPPGGHLEIDHWDRVGSIGVHIPGASPGINVF